ncbi:MucR family transcriptional regulator [Blastococcus sp. CT_GayMR19]|uniref:MucR family transcriptional regulator n=1 Tax=Blastococcus sp. CT_GayMR19 TaxID=2559608 RepID=UPI0010743973|nr:MucR family transcriptional regulator [Blastococcus sp. CT_GayMR19]TFV73363.1 MucR family transcriptional regulator [Blastococcus sp. CT_GayMR19]
MLHPVGKLPAAVYWRRRLTVLALLLAVLGGLGYLGFVLLSSRDDDATPAAAAATGAATSPARPPALERVVPSFESLSTPTPPAVLAAESVAAPAAPAAPAAGDPCSDDMITLEVRTPPVVAIGSKPTFELLVANVSAVPCVRTLDKGLQELLLLDAAGARIWGSNDCFPEASTDSRTLAPGETVAFPVLWGGLTSEPTCTAARAAPPAGAYLLRGRLDTKISADVAITLG